MISRETFLYTGQNKEDIPRSITHVRVDPSVIEIGMYAFQNCRQLLSVELCEGLEHIWSFAFESCTSLEQIIMTPNVKDIGSGAFQNCRQLMILELCEGLERIHDSAFKNCTSLQRIIIPASVYAINDQAFHNCRQLMNVDLNEWLESIEERAFCRCTSLEQIIIPPNVEYLEDRAFCRCTSLEQIIIPSNVEYLGLSVFRNCRQLMSVQLCEGLEKIHENAFQGCTSLRSIRIPSTVIFIHKDAFKDCSGLVEIVFCEVLEEFVHEVSLPWWNHGNSEESLRTYSFLSASDIPARLGRIKKRSWKTDIHDMLQRIPEGLNDDDNNRDYARNGRSFYLDSIKSRLSKYEEAQKVAPFLELALWKSHMEGQANSHLMKLQCRYNSLSMGPIIIPNVLSFLVGSPF
jgi:hypothetical protein